MNYHVSIPPAMLVATAKALEGWGIEPDSMRVAIAGVAAAEALRWHTDNPLVPITEETKNE